MSLPRRLKTYRHDAPRFRARLKLAIALRHPPTATWALRGERSRDRMAKGRGGVANQQESRWTKP